MNDSTSAMRYSTSYVYHRSDPEGSVLPLGLADCLRASHCT